MTNYINDNGRGGYGDGNEDGCGTTDGMTTRIAMKKMEAIALRGKTTTMTKTTAKKTMTTAVP